MTDLIERRRREAQEKLQDAFDHGGERLRGADDFHVQREIDRILETSDPSGRGGERTDARARSSERDAVNERLDQAADRRRVQHEVDRLVETPDSPVRSLERTEERLQRLDRISERDPMSDASGFNAEDVRQMEDLEIQTNPDAFIRRQEGGLDPDTERELRRSLRERRRE